MTKIRLALEQLVELSVNTKDGLVTPLVFKYQSLIDQGYSGKDALTEIKNAHDEGRKYFENYLDNATVERCEGFIYDYECGKVSGCEDCIINK